MPNQLPTLTEERSEELRMSTASMENNESLPSPRKLNNLKAHRENSKRESKGLQPLSEDSSKNLQQQPSQQQQQQQQQQSNQGHPPLERSSSLSPPRPPRRSVSVGTGMRESLHRSEPVGLDAVGLISTPQDNTDNTAAATTTTTTTLPPVSPLKSRWHSFAGDDATSSSAAFRRSTTQMNTPTRNPNASLQRHNSFRRAMSSFGYIAERNDGTSLASNITRKSNNIRAQITKKSSSALRFYTNKNFAKGGGTDTNDGTIDESTMSAKHQLLQRRLQKSNIGFSVGDNVLILHNRDEYENRRDSDTTSPNNQSTHTRHHHRTSLVKCVNRFGYPNGNGITIEEQRGPYIYVLGKVMQVHYEENAKFYTVQREDTGEDIRGDADFMEPILTKKGEEAARLAAAEFGLGAYSNQDGMDEHGSGMGSGMGEGDKNDTAIRVVENVCVIILLPIIWLYDCFVFIIGARLFRWSTKVYHALKRQANLFLNGMPPYECTTRITSVNLVVLCSIWYNFMDQARLAFFPTYVDYALAVINFGIWTVLTVELIFEVFIRPDDYRELIRSDKAYTPTTVRYISGIHLFFEFVSLVFFVPEFLCLFQSDLTCDGRPVWGLINATFLAVTGLNASHALAGRAIYACIRFRVFGLVRHWRSMWINRTFLKRRGGLAGQVGHHHHSESINNRSSIATIDGGGSRSPEGTTDHHHIIRGSTSEERVRMLQKQRDAALINASNIGTALMVTNSYRALSILCAILGLFPMITLINYKGVSNSVAQDMLGQLQATNKLITVENETNCEFLAGSVETWLQSFTPREKPLITSRTKEYVIALAIQPARCLDEFQSQISYEGIVFNETACSNVGYGLDFDGSGDCILGSLRDAEGDTNQEIAQNMGLRLGNLDSELSDTADLTLELQDGALFESTLFTVGAQFNRTYSVESSTLASFILQFCLLVTVLAGLLILREDAKDLVLGPLRSMLKIVARYAKNPLAQANPSYRDNISVVSDLESEFSTHLDDDDNSQEDDGFGTYETEQLITAVAKITDLLRKCWGVAGADIISTNLASREGALAEVFNPTVPGKSVYALFAFAAINGFDHALKCLGGDVMILINDVANVLHGEVFRWGFGDSGQCNKNLGAAFLMVFRIGLVKEVVEKLEEATKVVFSNSDAKRANVKRRNRNTLPLRNTDSKLNAWQKVAIAQNAASHPKTKHQKRQHDAMTDAMQLSLQSLPGISTFTDRAVIGMLKSFSGIHRDNKLRAWSRDFRLSAGVGTFTVEMIFGMDAGWAVEGAVGSEYKIDATYLSPHVNMASRMMSACKHYGVTILLSEAVQELMSDPARSKLRNLDRVTVKGSTKIQNIYTYDARHKGADFFLFSRSDEQADMEAERYAPGIWNSDQDLKAMRHHVTDDFELEFNKGMKAYYDGDWPKAIKILEYANEIMVDAAMEEGYLHDELDDSPDRKEFYRSETSDGPCSYLVHFMKSKKGVAPPGWAGWHPLLSK